MKNGFFIAIACMAVLIGACSPSTDFLVLKHGRGYYVGSNSNARYEMLCTSGEMDKVLASSKLSMELKNSLYKYSCSEERSGEKVKQLYAAMTVEQRKDIKNAFRINGFDINQGPGCCAD
ncbi:MAG: hypothetical protein M0R70_10005 [Nitrospirae bacterium]|nr:hypothetical protein [Nitrospirota bacterium]